MILEALDDCSFDIDTTVSMVLQIMHLSSDGSGNQTKERLLTLPIFERCDVVRYLEIDTTLYGHLLMDQRIVHKYLRFFVLGVASTLERDTTDQNAILTVSVFCGTTD